MLKLRKAEASDVDFIVAAIIAAESACSAEGQTAYEKMFNLPRAELQTVLSAVLESGGTGHQLTRQSFYVLDTDGQPAATCAAWVESSAGGGSGARMASALVRELGMQRFASAARQMRALSSAMPKRTPGAVQMETFYVAPQRRGMGLTRTLIRDVCDSLEGDGISFDTIEIALLDANTAARKAYERSGLALAGQTASQDPEFFELMGAHGFVQMRGSKLDVRGPA